MEGRELRSRELGVCVGRDNVPVSLLRPR
ncbi:hypothetical protein CCOS01_10425 [Colletotrichum costaricense]|uniref:Uncharacterized protein n=3 Tax=Colletotrichum acutatum species complex TaxID=2707335 RepID=A0A9Q8W8E1_9PEZI|nr:hypothetical protein CSPX01_10430 [Colletotrichum filicis]KAK1490292.1 hypothetical protein CTAM01_10765 [Colletotrichum tamarilloi]KAK1520306.1 hypothetical protein CCOS01_10425 [Colletotrichum costaricense]UQC73432.1 hypothetical protein CLUP02_00076 [Colletotrichum lupini]